MDELMEPTGTVEDAIRHLLLTSDEAVQAYLKESFLSQAMLSLFHARRDAGLTQAQVAERLGTKQSSIARLERDNSGSVTLQRFVEVALACGVMPLDLTLVPAEQLKQYVAHDPAAEKTQVAFSAWAASQSPVSLKVVTPLQTTVPSNTNSLQTSERDVASSSIEGGTRLNLGERAQLSLWSIGSPKVQTQIGGSAA